MRPESLASGIKKKGRDYRISLMQKGREGRMTFAEKNKDRSKSKKGSLPNKIQKRNKPMMMVKQVGSLFLIYFFTFHVVFRSEQSNRRNTMTSARKSIQFVSTLRPSEKILERRRSTDGQGDYPYSPFFLTTSAKSFCWIARLSIWLLIDIFFILLLWM